VKGFKSAKLRLAPVLDAAARASLARQLAERVLACLGQMWTVVVCDDEEVAEWATGHGARVAWTPGLGLSGAVTAGVSVAAAEGFELAVVTHADLPYAVGLDRLGEPGCVTLAPDVRRDGTNVAVVPSEAGFVFSYGKGSFERHRAEAARLGLPCRIVHDRRLAIDVDLPEDLAGAGVAI